MPQRWQRVSFGAAFASIVNITHVCFNILTSFTSTNCTPGVAAVIFSVLIVIIGGPLTRESCPNFRCYGSAEVAGPASPLFVVYRAAVEASLLQTVVHTLLSRGHVGDVAVVVARDSNSTRFTPEPFGCSL